MVLRVPSNPIHSVIPNALTKRFGIKRVGWFVFFWSAEHQSHWVHHGAGNVGWALVGNSRGGSEQVAGQLWDVWAL